MVPDPNAARAPVGQVAPEPTQTAGATGSVIVDQGRADRSPPSSPPSAETTQAAGAGGRVAPSPAPPQRFTLRGLEIDGGTAPARLLRPVTRRFLGRRMDTAALAALAQAVSTAYAKSDVALYTVLIPQQDFARGVVRVRVVEGWVESVSVHTKRGRRAPQVEAYARALLRERPLRKSSFDHAVLLMRSLPGVSVDVRFERGGRDGAVRLAVVVDTKRLQFGAGVGDRGTHLLGRTTIEADATLNSLFRQGDRTSLVFQTSLDFRNFRYIAASHQQPIGSHGLTVQGSLAYLTTRPEGETVNGAQVEGSAKVASLQLSYPAILTPTRTLYLTGSLDAVDSANALLGRHITDEKVRAVRGAAAFAQTLSPHASASVAVTLSQGLPGLGARPSSEGASVEDFRKVSINAAATATYGRWTVRLKGAAQATPDILPSSEMLALGGDDYGRAFPAAEVTGDQGAAGSAEVALSLTKALPPKLSTILAGSEAYAFVDGGRVSVHGRPELGLDAHGYALASTGLGLRAPLPFTTHGALQLEASRQLVADLPGGGDPDWRVVFGYRQSY